MTLNPPIACSLDANDLRRRLAALAAIGAADLLDHRIEDGRHVLRFRADDATRRRLDEIVAAESECCPFLDLALDEDDERIVLTIAAPNEARPVADELALAFAGDRA